MNVIHWDGFSEPPAQLRDIALTIGNFDGVHRGHAALLQCLQSLHERLNRPAVVATFEPPPLLLINPEAKPEPLTTFQQKISLLSQYPINHVLVFQTSSRLLALSAHDFWSHLLVERLRIKGLVEGANFRFGHQRAGTVPLLADWSAQQGIALEIVPDVMQEGRRISSSMIRALIRQGQVAQARSALGRPYRLTGLVERGQQRGQLLNYPTANLGGIQTILPALGVYAAQAIVDHQTFPAAVNVGANPTFGEDQLKVEAHLLDFSGDLYGQCLSLDFHERLRPTQAFSSVEGLREQLANDVEQTRQIMRSDRENQRDEFRTT